MSEPIRPIALCICRDGDRVLVQPLLDRVTGERFYRVIGGGLEFGERAADALRREWREELGIELPEPSFVGIIENVFTYQARRYHEVVFVFSAPTPEPLRGAGPFELVEADGTRHHAVWVTMAELESGPMPLYPAGVLDLVRGLARSGAGQTAVP